MHKFGQCATAFCKNHMVAWNRSYITVSETFYNVTKKRLIIQIFDKCIINKFKKKNKYLVHNRNEGMAATRISLLHELGWCTLAFRNK